MCGDSHLPPAPESGDLIAIIHPNAQSSFRGRLKLSNRIPGATTSSLQYENNSVDDEGLNVRIHKYGQPLSLAENEYSPSNPIMYSFVVAGANSTTGNVRLNLGVGGDGVVGRTVSIFDDRSRRILGEGVIGWS